MTSVLLLDCSVILNSYLIWVENPKATQCVCMCKSDPQWQSMRMLRAITGEQGGQLIQPVYRGDQFTVETHKMSLQICYMYQKYKASRYK